MSASRAVSLPAASRLSHSLRIPPYVCVNAARSCTCLHPPMRSNAQRKRNQKEEQGRVDLDQHRVRGLEQRQHRLLFWKESMDGGAWEGNQGALLAKESAGRMGGYSAPGSRGE